MGAFFTSVQVLIGDRSQERAQTELINTLKEFICADDFVETSNTAEADRSVFVVTSINSRWMTIFDEVTDSLIELAIITSRVAGKAAIAIQVYHSDYCEFTLCRNGEQIDAFNSDLDYWGGYISNELREEYAGKPELWQDLLVDGKTPADLRAAWDSNPLMAEDIVYKMSPLLALDSFLANHSYRYFSQELEKANEEEFKDFRIIRLIFRSKDRDNRDAPQYAPPKLALSSLGHELKLRLDQPGNISLSVNNQGGPLKGMKIYIWGDAVDKDLLRLGDEAQVKIFRGVRLSSNNIQVYQQKWAKERRNDLDLNVAEIADFECPAMAFNKDVDHLSSFHINVPVTPLKLGQDEINLVAMPVENPKDGQLGYRIKIQVVPPPTLTNKPLKAEPVYEYQHQTIQRLETPKFLLAMVSMNLDRKTAFPIAIAAIARWHQVVVKYAGKEYLCHYDVGRDKKLKKLKLLIKDIPNGKNWQTLCDQIEICEAFDGVSPETANYNDANCGFGFDANTRFFQLPTPDGKYVDIKTDAVVPHWSAAAQAAVSVRQIRPDLAWPYAVLGWDAERSGNHRTALDYFLVGLRALGTTQSFTEYWQRTNFPAIPNFAAERLFNLTEYQAEAFKRDHYFQALAEIGEDPITIQVRNYWLREAEQAKAAGDYAKAYQNYYAAGWDVLVTNNMHIVLQGLQRTAEQAGFTGLSKLANHHKQCFIQPY
ncbi:MAG: hypothetical protein AB1489_29645 [Acidobacteriota bacterium]